MSDQHTIGISSAEIKRFQAQLKKFNEKKTKQLQDLTQLSGVKITSAAKSKAPRYQSRLINSIRPIASKNRLSVRVNTNVEYAPFVEFGTKSKAQIPAELAEYASQFKSTSPANFEQFYKDIKKWCQKKGIDEKAAYPIAVSLIKNGQRAQPFLYPAFKAEKSKFINAIKQLIAKP